MEVPPFISDPIYLAEAFPQYIRDREEFVDTADRQIDENNVWIHAHTRDTNTPVIIQERKIREERDFIMFLRCFYCMAVCQGTPWVVPLVGVVLKKPYCLIYEATNKIPLTDYLEKSGGPGDLTGERLANFIVSLAGAICVAHSHDIRLCSLGPDMILLDEATLSPSIYNLAFCAIHPVSPDFRQDQRRLKFCAPECLASDCKWGKEIDVWSLALVLGCVCSGTREAFPGESTAAVKERLENGKTKVKLDFPKDVKKVLSLCLKRSVSRRPPLQEIVNTVCRPGVFKDVDNQKLQVLAVTFGEIVERQQTTVLYWQQPAATSLSIIENLKQTHRPVQPQVAVSIKSPADFEKVKQILSQRPDRVGNDVRALHKYYLDQFRELVLRSESDAEVLFQQGFFEIPILGQPYFVSTAFEFWEFIVTRRPSWVNPQMAPMFRACIRWRGDLTMHLFAFFMSRLRHSSQVSGLVTIVLEQCKQLVASQYAEELVRAVSRACRHDRQLTKDFDQQVTELYTTFLESSTTSVVRTTYAAIQHIRLHESASVPLQTLVRHLKNEELQWSAVLYLAKLRQLSASIQHINIFAALFAAAQKEVVGFYALSNLARERRAAEKLFMPHQSWLYTPLPTMNDTFKLFLILYEHDSCREKLMSQRATIDLWRNVLELMSKEHIMALAYFLKRLKISIILHRHLQATGFVSTLFDLPERTNDEDIWLAVIACFDKLAEVQYLEEYDDFVPWVIDRMSDGTELSIAAVHAVSRLSAHQQLHQILLSYDLVDYFQRLGQEMPAFAGAAKEFLSHISGQ